MSRNCVYTVLIVANNTEDCLLKKINLRPRVWHLISSPSDFVSDSPKTRNVKHTKGSKSKKHFNETLQKLGHAFSVNPFLSNRQLSTNNRSRKRKHLTFTSFILGYNVKALLKVWECTGIKNKKNVFTPGWPLPKKRKWHTGKVACELILATRDAVSDVWPWCSLNNVWLQTGWSWWCWRGRERGGQETVRAGAGPGVPGDDQQVSFYQCPVPLCL